MWKPTAHGPWLLLDRIAIGGMAEVFLATRAGAPAGQLYALKRILPSLAEDAEFVAMFLDEARLVAHLAHPAIVSIHELGKHGDGYYIAMDYVAGRDLRALLDRMRTRAEPFPVPLAAWIGMQVADALDHAHRKRAAGGAELRVVHRDVSPANILLGFDGSVRVIDFGIAQAELPGRLRDARERRGGAAPAGQAREARHEAPRGRGGEQPPCPSTSSGPAGRGGAGRGDRRTALRGKFGYMSPEVVRGLPVDRRSDVFSLGVVLHELLTGERLFAGRSELATLERVRSAEVRAPSARRAGIPPALDALVLRALAREPEERPPWASDLRDALAPFASAGARPGGAAVLAQLMARAFPGEPRLERERIERLRSALPGAAAPPPEPPAEPTQVIAFGDLES
jgi:serine/threonine-protein kinase